MRKYLILIVVAVFSLVIISSYQADVQVPTSEPNQSSTRTQVHELTDRTAQAAISDQWVKAGYETEKLQQIWTELKPESKRNLDITVTIDLLISNLVDAVWSQNKTEVVSITLELKQIFVALFED